MIIRTMLRLRLDLVLFLLLYRQARLVAAIIEITATHSM